MWRTLRQRVSHTLHSATRFLSKGCAAAVIVFGGSSFLFAATDVSGTVVTHEGSRVVPVFRARVLLREGTSAQVTAVARTDRDGRFVISGLSHARVSLSVEKDRYFTSRANGRDAGETLSLDCSDPADCTNITFELGLGGVVTGMVRDEFGEPVASAMIAAVMAETAHREDGGVPAGRTGSDGTDDRGYFRLYGLKPGRYVLKTGNFHGYMTFSGEEVEVEVEEGREISGVLITGRRAEASRRYTVSGKVTGLKLAGLGILSVSEVLEGPGSSLMAMGLGSDGQFSFSLRAGRYSFGYTTDSSVSVVGNERSVPLGILDVQSNLNGIELKPLAPAGFAGALRFESGQPPPAIWVSATSGVWNQVRVEAKAPDYRFEITNLSPGTYEFHFAVEGSPRKRRSGGFFLRGAQRGTQTEPIREFTVTSGQIDKVELVLSSEVGRVFGTVKAKDPAAENARREGAQFRVGLAGPKGFDHVQADQNGQFEFVDVVPGEYRICAWSDIDTFLIYGEDTWTAAGDSVRKFSVEPGSEVEINLTAAP